MAKIFISYSNRDKKLIRPYTEQLVNRGHQILMDETVVEVGDDFQKALLEALNKADGAIVFLTKNGIESKNVVAELGIARSHYDNKTNKKFLIPIVSHGMEVPYIIRDLEYIEFDEIAITETAINENIYRIEQAINEFSKKYKPSEVSSDFEILTINSKGEKVKEVQEALKHFGFFKSAIDGIYGHETQNAVLGFQMEEELPQTGEVDEATYSKIKKSALSASKSNNNTKETNFVNQREHSSIVKEETQNENQERDYEFLENEDAKNGVLKTNYLFVRIGFLRLKYMFRSQSEETSEIDFRVADWHGLSAFFPYSIITPQVRILPFIDVPVNNIPLVIKPMANVTEPQPPNSPSWEGLEFKWRNDDIFKHQITIEKLVSEIPSLKAQKLLGNEKIFEGAIFISEDEYHKIIELGTKGFAGERFIKSSLSRIFTDNPSADVEDEIDFKSDINALASVIAYKEVHPPLAIGLFGNWGSGKSFFMNELEKKIKAFANSKNDVYCHEVVQVKFNSWHYSDSNLWASLITQIFEDLRKYKKDDSKGLDTLIKNLNSTKELIAESEIKLERINKEKAELDAKKTKTEKEIVEKSKRLASLKVKDIMKIVWKNKAVVDNVEQIEKLLPGTLIDNFQIVRTKVNELSSIGNQIFESFRIIYQFRKGEKPMALLVAFSVIILFCILILVNSDKSITFLNWLNVKSAFYVTVLTQIFGFLIPVRGKVNTAYKNLKALESTYFELAEKEKATHNQEINDLTNQLELKKAELNMQEIVMANLEQTHKQQTQDIDDIISGKKLNRFFENKASDKRYIESLGIISWIRKDFEELDFLLKIQNEITDDKLKELNRERVKDIFKIDRIILYIDDLDRCNQDIVVHVLEAIHLLLAFPLFVVVVGVDPRWMHNALTLKYKDFLSIDPGEKKKSESNKEKTSTEIDSSDENEQDLMTKPATSYDYLEKIFQVPFVLKSIDDAGKDRLIMSKFKQMKEEEKPVKQEPEKPAKASKPVLKKLKDKKPEVGYQTNVDVTNNVSFGSQTLTSTQGKLDEQALLSQSELLKVSDTEIEFMQGISFLIGETPRIINRYINIYRIIRTHSKFEFIDNNEFEHYCAAMLLLAVITGLPVSAKHFFEKINAEPDSTTFGVFIKAYVEREGEKEKLLKTLVNEMEKEESLKNSGNETGKEKSLKNLGDIQLIKFKKNLNLISRFTFRNLC